MDIPYLQAAEKWMRLALAEADKALTLDEVPIGCVIVHDSTQQVIGHGFNRRQSDADATAHAEILAIRAAGKHLGDWRLEDCTIVVTLEPCPMCAGAIVNARVPRLIYGCTDPKAGAVDTLMRLCNDSRLNHQVDVTAGVLADEGAQLLKEFFKAQRSRGKK